VLQVDPRDRAKLIEPLFSSDRRFWLLVGFLVVVIGWGAVMYLRQLAFGLGETGMQRPVFWGVYMVNFIFFIGISHAGTLISAILRVTHAEWRRPITRVAEAITVFALMVGSLQILFDMGRPDRLLSVLLHGRLQSPLLWDAISVTAYLLGSITYLYLPLIPDVAILRDSCTASTPGWRRRLYTTLAVGWRGNRTQWQRLERAIGAMAVIIIPVAVSVHTIISWILATTVQPGWHSTIFGPYFVVGAIFSGIGALFIAMSVVRAVMGLEAYIGERQYRNLGYVFIAMTAIWFYFSFAEHLTLAAGQQTAEYAVLVSKLWGRFAPTLWGMVAFMAVAFWVLVVPLLVPGTAIRRAVFRPRMALASSVAAASFLVILVRPVAIAQATILDTDLRLVAALGLLSGLVGMGLGSTMWLKRHWVARTVIAAACVVAGMWLERWNIVVPTLTFPRLIASVPYTPTWTEIALTAASLALFSLLFMVFFKLFPAVSMWEVAEGRAIDEAASRVRVAPPQAARM